MKYFLFFMQQILHEHRPILRCTCMGSLLRNLVLGFIFYLVLELILRKLTSDTRVAQKVMPHIFFLGNYLFRMYEIHAQYN